MRHGSATGIRPIAKAITATLTLTRVNHGFDVTERPIIPHQTFAGLPRFAVTGGRRPGASAELGWRAPSHVSFAAIGMRRPVPNAREVTLIPRAAWLRLCSLAAISRMTRSTVGRSNPAATISSAL